MKAVMFAAMLAASTYAHADGSHGNGQPGTFLKPPYFRVQVPGMWCVPADWVVGGEHLFYCKPLPPCAEKPKEKDKDKTVPEPGTGILLAVALLGMSLLAALQNRGD